MTDTEKLDLLREALNTTITTVKVVNGMQRGTEKAAGERERKAWKKVASLALNRAVTAEELDSLFN